MCRLIISVCVQEIVLRPREWTIVERRITEPSVGSVITDQYGVYYFRRWDGWYTVSQGPMTFSDVAKNRTLKVVIDGA